MKKTCKANLPAMIFLFALLILWQAGAMGLDAAYILPSPTQILAKLWELRDVLFTVHLPATMLVTAIGLGISLVLGLALAVVMDESDLVRKMIYPIVVVSQTIPTTAIAPLFVLWFGYGIWSKVLVTVLITFFPITITVYDGLRSAKTEMAELLETYGATKKDIFLKIKVPCALPYFFSAVKMAVPMSIIGRGHRRVVGGQERPGLLLPPHDDPVGRRRGVRPYCAAVRGGHPGGGHCEPAGKAVRPLEGRVLKPAGRAPQESPGSGL